MRIGLAEIGRVMSRGTDSAPCASDANITFEKLLGRLGVGDEAVIFGPSHANVLEGVEAPLSNVRGNMPRILQACHTAETCDALVVFIGFHATVSLTDVIPKLNGTGNVSPLETFKRTVAPIIAAVNFWQNARNGKQEPVYICNDPRSKLIARDLKWPPRNPILAQWTGVQTSKHFRFGDSRLPDELGYQDVDPLSVLGHWVTVHRYVYGSIEMSGIR